MTELLAGFARADTTPPPGTPHAGWGAQTHQRDSGHDLPLEARCLVLSEGDTTLAIVDIDIIHVSAEIEQRAVQLASAMTGIEANHIRISATHTHSGPNTFRLPMITEGLETVLRYLEGLPDRIAGTVHQASRSLRPVRFAAGIGSCDINVNRRFQGPDGRWVVGRNPKGSVDRTVKVIRFDDLNQAPVAVVLHYACHPTIMGWQNQLVTPDYPGAAKRVVEQQLGCGCLFLQGAAGNIGPREGFTGDCSIYRRLGAILGLEAAKVALNIDTLPRETTFRGYQESGAAIALYRDEPLPMTEPRLAVIAKSIALPVRSLPDPDLLDADASRLRGELAHIRVQGTEQEVRDARAAATQAGMRADRARMVYGRTHLDRRLCGIRLGSIALVSTQGEPFIEMNERIVKASPFAHTLFSGYSHGGAGYIPTRSAYEEGGYEVETTPFTPDAEDVLVEESIALLRELGGVPE